MQVKILEESIKHEIDGILNVFTKDEVRSVPDEVGQYFCANGWAEDVAGDVETVERDANADVSLDVDSVVSNVEVTNG
jgi:hypothetical protein